MNPITYQEAFQMLRRAGFAGAEIDRLYRLRRAYGKSELDQPPLDLSHLQFVRWLVATGRLTDQLAERREQCAPRLDEEAGHLREPSPTRFAFPLFRRKK